MVHEKGIVDFSIHLVSRFGLDDGSSSRLEQVIMRIREQIERRKYWKISTRRYVPEGNMTSCGTDYLNREWYSKSYILVYSVFAYFTPLFTITWAYYSVTRVRNPFDLFTGNNSWLQPSFQCCILFPDRLPTRKKYARSSQENEYSFYSSRTSRKKTRNKNHQSKIFGKMLYYFSLLE